MYSWRTELNRCLIILVITGLFGLLIDRLLLVWVVTLSAFVVINIYRLRRLNLRLLNTTEENKVDPPERFGFRGEISNQEQESSAALEMAIIVVTKQGNLGWWNSASEKLLGLKYPQDRDQSTTNFINNPQFTEYFHSNNYADTLKLKAPGDSKKIIEYQIALFGGNGLLMIVRDVTQLQRLENMRKDFVGNVSHELGTPITEFKG